MSKFVNIIGRGIFYHLFVCYQLKYTHFIWWFSKPRKTGSKIFVNASDKHYEWANVQSGSGRIWLSTFKSQSRKRGNVDFSPHL
jgi:hypothetical protein